MPIRRGDGVSLAPKYFQEVRKGDGTILYNSVRIDDHEDNDLAEYTVSGTATTSTAAALEGTYGAELAATDPPSTIYSTAGLENYPNTGQRFKSHVYRTAIDEGVLALQFAGPDADNCYEIGLNFAKDELQVRERSAGSPTVLATAAVTLTNGTEYILEGRRESDDTVTGWVSDATGTQLATTNAVSSHSYTSDGYGCLSFHGASNGDGYFDNARIQS